MRPTKVHSNWCNLVQDTLPNSDRYVLDGDDLLHRIHGHSVLAIVRCAWFNTTVYEHLASNSHLDYHVDPFSKHVKHPKRTQGKIGAAVTFINEMKLIQKKDSFLSNAVYKQKIINMLGEYLQPSGCKVLHAADDADLHVPINQYNMQIIWSPYRLEMIPTLLFIYVTTPSLMLILSSCTHKRSVVQTRVGLGI